MQIKASIIIIFFSILVNFVQSQNLSHNQSNSSSPIPITPAPKNTNVVNSITDKTKLSPTVGPATSSVTPSTDNTTQKCVCDGALLPQNGKEVEICAHCKCKYENRNTTLIKVVVIIVIWVISILVIYMLFLMCLDPLLNKRVKSNYEEHTNEDDDTGTVIPPNSPNTQEMNTRGANVLNRVTNQTDKWKKQVREQRRNIYDRRSMLN